MATPSVCIYGGKGALGSVCVTYFKEKGFHTISVDLVANEEADGNVVLSTKQSLSEQNQKVVSDVQTLTKGNKLKGIICVAGGWAGGNAASEELIRNTELMFKQSVWTSIICTRLAALCLEPNGLICLTGAVPALGATPGMIGYGMAKAAVHQLVKSLAADGSGLPEGASAVAILPMTLDTPMNRKFMKGADTSSWTPLETVAKLIHGWVSSEAPASGSLAQIITQNAETTVVIE
eukprot:TRINITY_DN12495_c0_g3_i1.p1 TRINITY_DN12495_c0_g3~~TRINITY_DN12495_c0_g3_i1.p1  ORF type:complete len:235 (+),score=57.51 TRINITY_DN12495_c0_g3_i1:37-741(+)